MSAACAGQNIPASVTTNLSKAETLIDQAARAPAKKVAKLRKKAKKALRRAQAKATRATKGRKAKLSSDCALRKAADGVLAELGM